MIGWVITAQVWAQIRYLHQGEGRPVALVVIVLIVMLGNTSSGGPVGRPLLSAPFSAPTPVFPQGAVLGLVRGRLYFDGYGAGPGVISLAVRAVCGALFLLSGAAGPDGSRDTRRDEPLKRRLIPAICTLYEPTQAPANNEARPTIGARVEHAAPVARVRWSAVGRSAGDD